METLIITIRSEAKRGQIEQMLRNTEGVDDVKYVRSADEVSAMAQPALAEGWNSPEDQRWDSLL